jgi:hypothetical protein
LVPYFFKGDAAMRVLAIIIGVLVLIGLMVPRTEQAKGAPPPDQSARPPDPRSEALKNVALKAYDWSKGGFGNVMLLNQFSIFNAGNRSVKDFRIACELYAPSGTRVGKTDATLYETVRPKQTRTFKQLNLGLIHSQSAQASCQIVGIDIGD